MNAWLVTGGAGFIGANFVQAAVRLGTDSVIVLDALTYAGHRENLKGVLENPRVVFIQADVCDQVAVEKAFCDHRPTAVIHFAAETHVDRSIDGPRAFVRTNVCGTQEMLEGARRHLDRLTIMERERFRFVQVSTDEVYGSLGPVGRFTEETNYAPSSPYSASKAAADHLVYAYHVTYGLPTLITNCSNNYGPYQFPEKLIPLMILNALDGRPLPLYGDGGNVRDWLYVEDHVEGIVRAIERGRPGEKYNFGGNAERTNLQVVNALCQVLEMVAPATQNEALRVRKVAGYRDLVRFVKDRPGHDRRYAIDSTKARRELAWRPSHEFEAGMEQTVRWYAANRQWCEAVQAKGYRRERLGVLPSSEQA